MPNTSSRKSADRSNHGAAGRLLVDDPRDRPREARDRDVRERETRPEDRERELEILYSCSSVLRDGARLIVLRLAIAQMFSSRTPIIPRREQIGQHGHKLHIAALVF